MIVLRGKKRKIFRYFVICNSRHNAFLGGSRVLSILHSALPVGDSREILAKLPFICKQKDSLWFVGMRFRRYVSQHVFSRVLFRGVTSFLNVLWLPPSVKIVSAWATRWKKRFFTLRRTIKVFLGATCIRPSFIVKFAWQFRLIKYHFMCISGKNCWQFFNSVRKKLLFFFFFFLLTKAPERKPALDVQYAVGHWQACVHTLTNLKTTNFLGLNRKFL